MGRVCLLKYLVFEKECSELFFNKSCFKVKQKQKAYKKNNEKKFWI